MSNLVSILGIGDILLDGCRMLTHLIDEGIYTIIQIAYQVFAALANASLLSGDAGGELVKIIMDRVYIVMAIVMVFVLAFNLLQYIIDPDKINDKKVGATAFVKDVIIAIAIISFTPMLFSKLYSFQSRILESNVIGNLILGGTDSELAKVPDDLEGDDKNISYMAYAMKNGAYNMTATVYSAFLYPNISKSDDTTNEQLWTARDCQEVDVRSSEPPKNGMPNKVFNYCKHYVYVQKRGDLRAFDDHITDNDFNFVPFLSTIAGVVLLFFILSFCVNMAKRVGKLAVIQLIAPVPAVLEILPNKKGVRENWFKTLVQVYLETFEYLAIMYLIMFLISLVPTAVDAVFENLGLGSLVSIFTSVFLIYGLLQFGKEAPKLLMDLLGIKESGTIKEAFKRAVSMGSVTANTAASMGSNAVKNFSQTEGGGLRKIGSAFAGAASAGGRSILNARNVHNWKDAVSGRQRINASVQQARIERDRYRNQHGGTIGAMKGRVEDFQSGISSRVNEFIHGSNLAAGNAELQSYGEYKSVFDATKIKTGSDERYMSFQKDLDKVFADSGININEFNARKKSYLDAHQGATLNDYLASNEFAQDFGTAGVFASDEISRLSGAMDAREEAMKVDKKGDIMVAVERAKALVNGNSNIAMIAKDAGIDINSIDITSASSRDDVIKAYDTLKKLDKKIGDRMNDVRKSVAGQEMRDKMKKSSGGSGDSGGSKK